MQSLIEIPALKVSQSVRQLMARKGKWIDVEHPDDPVAEVARQAIEMRLDVLWQRLHAAADGPLIEVDNVHQLRVASRRAAAAISIFDDLIPKRRGRWMRKQLKAIRKAAGEARDLDVLGASLAKRALEPDQAFCLPIIDRIQAARKAAQEPISRIRDKLVGKNFERRQGRLLGRIGDRQNAADCADMTFAEFARESMQRTADEFFAAARGDLSDLDRLHELRIEAKQLRYAMEVFASAFPPRFRKELYPQVEAVQEKLGEVNDHFVACRQFSQWLSDAQSAATADGLARLVAEEENAIAASQAQFVAEWTQSKSDAMNALFDELLPSQS